MCTVSILLWTLWFTSSGDWWGCSSSPEKWHDHEVPGTQTGPGSQALLPHWQAKTEQVLTGLCTLHTHTHRWIHSQYLLSLSFVVVLDVFIAHSLVIQGQAPDHCFFTCVVCLPVYWDISLTRTFACSNFKCASVLLITWYLNTALIKRQVISAAFWDLSFYPQVRVQMNYNCKSSFFKWTEL